MDHNMEQNAPNVTTVQTTSSVTDAVTMFVVVQLSVVFVLGFSGNLCILIFMPLAKTASKTRLLLCAQAFADLGAVAVNVFFTLLPPLVPMFTGVPFQVQWTSLTACKMIPYFSDVFELASQATAAVLAMERCYVVHFPLKAASLSFRTTLCALLFSFVVCFCITSPELVYYGFLNGDGGLVCTYLGDQTASAAYMLARHLFIEHLLCNVIIAVCNTLIFVRLLKRQQKQSKIVRQTETSAEKKSNLRVTIALVIVSSAHVVLFTPCGVACYLKYLYASTVLVNTMFNAVMASYAIYANTHYVNFLIYITTIEAFRDVFKRFCCRAN